MSVAAMHRARWLAQQYLDPNLATDIRSNLAKICTPQELQHIEVSHLYAWVSSYLCGFAKRNGQTSFCPRPATPWRMTWRPSGLAEGPVSMSKKRVQIWPVLDNLRSELQRRSPPGVQPTASFRLIRALAGADHADDLFIVGDSHQRIYGRPLVLSQYGMHVRGRSHKLRITYRTTEETRAWASAVLSGFSVDDLDGGADSGKDYRSMLHGEAPLIRGCQDPAEEVNVLVDLLNGIQRHDGSLRGTCVTYKTHKVLRSLSERFGV
jgi:hypothetical protein